MAACALVGFLEQVRRSALLREVENQTDGQLLETFIRTSDKLALEALILRHAPMVWGVCRRTLLNDHDAEDAFQAAFLVFARKASSLRSRVLLANWLYGVARKTACKARQVAAKRCAREKQVDVMPEPEPVESSDKGFGHELRPLLDQELSRLPEKYRVAVVLCDLEGRSRPEVARQLCLKVGTVGSRLARGRALLAKRLARRGLDVSASSLAPGLSYQVSLGSVPPAVLGNTIDAAALFAGGEATATGAISAQVSALTKGVLHTMVLARQKAAGILLFMAAAVLAGGMVTYHMIAGQQNQPEPPPITVQEGKPGPDLKMFGTEADAMEVAMEMVDNESDFPSFLGKSPLVNGRYRITQAKLDQEKGTWTVTGLCRIDYIPIVQPIPPAKTFESDWVCVVRCSSPPAGRAGHLPATRPRGEWTMVSHRGKKMRDKLIKTGGFPIGNRF
jgi:RNA polymerase sigma factor (sigma-70 family)